MGLVSTLLTLSTNYSFSIKSHYFADLKFILNWLFLWQETYLEVLFSPLRFTAAAIVKALQVRESNVHPDGVEKLDTASADAVICVCRSTAEALRGSRTCPGKAWRRKWPSPWRRRSLAAPHRHSRSIWKRLCSRCPPVCHSCSCRAVWRSLSSPRRSTGSCRSSSGPSSTPAACSTRRPCQCRWAWLWASTPAWCVCWKR